MRRPRKVHLAFAVTLLFALPVGASDPGVARNASGSRSERLFLATCTPCHGTSAVASRRDGPGGWRQTVNTMMGLGAQVYTREELEAIVAYLSATYGPAAGAMTIGKLPPGAALGSVEPAALPKGPGADLVGAYCSMCHDLGIVVATRRRAEEWRRITAAMLAKAGVPPDNSDLRALNDYLIANFGDGASAPR